MAVQPLRDSDRDLAEADGSTRSGRLYGNRNNGRAGWGRAASTAGRSSATAGVKRQTGKRREYNNSCGSARNLESCDGSAQTRFG